MIETIKMVAETFVHDLIEYWYMVPIAFSVTVVPAVITGFIFEEDED